MIEKVLKLKLVGLRSDLCNRQIKNENSLQICYRNKALMSLCTLSVDGHFVTVYWKPDKEQPHKISCAYNSTSGRYSFHVTCTHYFYDQCNIKAQIQKIIQDKKKND